MTQRHNQALDGLRWFAFLGVFLYHSHETLFHFGKYGVQVFFVLSGFLIGNILLSLREQTGIPLSDRLKAFYIRRSLRIFPLYYFVLLMILILGATHLLQNGRLHVLPYHAAYLTNFYLAFSQDRIDSQTHFWSLCVEEHFYLIAPFLLLRAAYRRLESGFVWLFLLVTIARLLNFFVWKNDTLNYLSPMQFDIMLFGVITAMVLNKGAFFQWKETHLQRAGIICGIGVLLVMVLSLFPSHAYYFIEGILFPPMLSIAVAAFVLALWRGKLPTVSRLLSWPPFAYLGKISYGLYIYHNFFYVIARHTTGMKHELMLALCLLATILVSMASWHLFENPINNLKRLFPYPKNAG